VKAIKKRVKVKKVNVPKPNKKAAIKKVRYMYWILLAS
jgi:hypothetical protein